MSEEGPPVLIIDEANQLMQWQNTSPAELAGLLSFFVRLTKQSGECHVIMVTSDDGYQALLSQGG